MANRERGEMTLAAGESTYVMRLTTNACCDLEDRSGKLLDDVVRGAFRGSVRDLRWLLWGSLQDRHADTVKTPEDAGRVIDAAGGIQGVLAQVTAFMKLNADPSPPAKEAAPVDPPSAQSDRAGVDSTSTLAPAG